MKNLNNIRHSFVPLEDKSSSTFVVLENDNDTQVGISDYGARITHFVLQTSKDPIDIVLGFDKLEYYFSAHEKYHGVTVGPYANRIANGKFSLNDKLYVLAQNNGPNCLHGGEIGFHNRFWKIEAITRNSVTLSVNTEEGEEGFPGGLFVQVKYTLGNDNGLSIEYFAKSKLDTPINLTNHAYFNLNGSGSGDISAHLITINASSFAVINEHCIPTGELRPVAETAFDFRNAKAVSQDINKNDEQLIIGNGYDHSFHLKPGNTDELVFAASAEGDVSGVRLEVYTTEPAMQFYTGNYLDNGDLLKGGIKCSKRSAFCFETQHHPDSPNRTEFPTTILKAGEEFYSKTIYKVVL